MPTLQRHLDGAHRAHRLLAERVAALTDHLVAQPSLLPDWTVGHVLTHVARNADATAHILRAAGRGEVVDQYPGGAAGRAADIEAGAARPAQAIIDDVATSSAALDHEFAVATDRTWAGHGVNVFGQRIPCDDIAFRRQREVWMHLYDLGHVEVGLGIDPSLWPTDWMREEEQRLTATWASRRSMGMTTLPAEVLAEPEQRRVLWLFGRIDIAGVEPAQAFP